MTLIVDASVAIKWFVAEVHHEAALDLLGGGERLEAPDLLLAEVANIAWKKTLLGEVEAVQAEAIVQALPHYLARLHATKALVDRALSIALELSHPVYDGLYLACAESVDEVLITADGRLVRAASATPYAAHVRVLG